MVKDLGLLVARGVAGGGMAAHGAQKYFAAFDGPGLEGAGAFFEQLGLVPGELHAQAAALAEMASGALIAAGLFNPAGPAVLWSTMLVAMQTAHAGKGFFAGKGGVEVPLLYATAGLALACSGPGKYSLDALLHVKLDAKGGRIFWAYAVATAAALAILAQREPPPPAPAPEPPAEPQS
jgi:putative oxidoreductase